MTGPHPFASTVHDILQPVLGAWTVGVAARAGDTTVKVCLGDVSASVPMNSQTVMYGASLTKQFIGILIAQLVDAGAIDTEQSLRHFIPTLPAWADAIRIRHLLSHTAGFPAAKDILARWLGLPVGVEGERQWTNAKVIEALSAQPVAHRLPGILYEYSNVGYICLAEVIRRCCNEPVEKVAHARVFVPLKMEKSYMGSGEDTPHTIGDGGLWTTIDDLLKWNDAMNVGYFGKNVHMLVETPGHLDDGTLLDYAWGLRVYLQYGKRTLSHGGGWPGRCAKIIRQPEAGISLALLTTCSDVERINNAAAQTLKALQDKNS
jgi:CubicO group peptidase (beta-lactamase class C family)